MQKIYLLLRSNKQTGPYTLEELLQLNLKPFDLVWVEGRSAAWQYPFEIPALKAYVPETPQASVPFQPIATSAMEEKNIRSEVLASQKPKSVFVSVPKPYAVNNEQRANEQRTPPEDHKAFMPSVAKEYYEANEVKSTPSYSSGPLSYTHQKPVEEKTVHANYSRSLNEVETDYINPAYRQKTKKKFSLNTKDLLLAVLILIVIGGTYYIMTKPSIVAPVVTANKLTTPASQQTTQNNTTESEQNSATVVEEQEPSSPEQKKVSATIASQSAPSKNAKPKNPSIVSKSQTNSSVPSSQNPMPVEKTTSNIPSADNEVVSKNPGVKQPAKTETTEKKKKIADVLKGIFSKKEKKAEPTQNEPTVLEDPKPANNRQAARREDTPSNNRQASDEVSTTALMQQVDLSSNAPDNWMMGVRNLKITLRNRSNVTIQTASVTVNYYDENDQVLEKKTVYFNNVAPKGKATVAAPDQKWADHVDFKLVSVSAKDDRYAGN